MLRANNIKKNTAEIERQKKPSKKVQNKRKNMKGKGQDIEKTKKKIIWFLE